MAQISEKLKGNPAMILEFQQAIVRCTRRRCACVCARFSQPARRPARRPPPMLAPKLADVRRARMRSHCTAQHASYVAGGYDSVEDFAALAKHCEAVEAKNGGALFAARSVGGGRSAGSATIEKRYHAGRPGRQPRVLLRHSALGVRGHLARHQDMCASPSPHAHALAHRRRYLVRSRHERQRLEPHDH
jgi:hypothetical protein